MKEMNRVLNMENGCSKGKPIFVANSRTPDHLPRYGRECSRVHTAKRDWDGRDREIEDYNPDIDDDCGKRRYTETDGIIGRIAPTKSHICSGYYHGTKEKGYFVPAPNRTIMKEYRQWSKIFTKSFKHKTLVLPQNFFKTEPYIVFFDYKHNIFAIYYGVEGYCYSFDKSRIDNKEKLLGWITHLSRKRWFSRKHLSDLVLVWEDVFKERADCWR